MPEGTGHRHRRGTCPRSSSPRHWSSAATAARRRHDRRVPAPAARPRLQGHAPCRRRPAPTTCTWRSAACVWELDGRRTARRRWCWCPSGDPRGRSAAPASTGSSSTSPGRAPRTSACWRSCARSTVSSSRESPRPPEDGAGIDLDGRAARDAHRAGRARAALPGGGDRRPRDPPVREVPAVEGPRRALGRARARTRWSHHLIHDADRAVRRPGAATPAAAPTSTRSAQRCPVPADASQLAGDRRGRGRAHLRPRGSTRNRQVADHHQPADPRGRRRQAGAVRRREAGGARRRHPATRRRSGMGPFCPRPARQGSRARRCPRADQARAGPRRRRRPSRAWPPTSETLRLGPPAARPLRRPAARDERRRPLATTRRARRSCATGDDVDAAAGARRSSRRRRPRCSRAVRTALAAAARRRRPGPPAPRPPVGIRRTPPDRRPVPAHPGRGRRGRRGRARRVGGARAGRRPAPRPGTPTELDALAHVLRGPGWAQKPRRARRDRHRRSGRRRPRPSGRDRGRSPPFRHPGLDVVHARGADAAAGGDSTPRPQTAADSSFFGREAGSRR